MFCPNCGKEAPLGAKFCGECGAPLATQTPPPTPSTSAPAGGTVKIIDDSTTARFRVKCEYCLCEFEYGIGDLGYRAWYPHGFIYCPKCRKPLRHRLEYRV